MRFVIDENLSQELVERLQQLGHEVLSITNLQPGLKNGAVLAYAWQQQAILVTSDKSDFGELIFREGQPCLGLIVVRLPPDLPPVQKVETVVSAVIQYNLQLVGAVTVLSQQPIRIHRLPTVAQSPEQNGGLD